MNSVDQKYLPVFCLLAIIFISSFVFAGGVDDLHILKISAQDERAIIKTPDGKMQIIKPGDVVGEEGLRVENKEDEKQVAGCELRVVEIAEGRVVFEEKNGEVTERVIIRLIDGKQKIERIRKTAEHVPAMLAPAERDRKATNNVSEFH